MLISGRILQRYSAFDYKISIMSDYVEDPLSYKKVNAHHDEYSRAHNQVHTYAAG